MRSKTGELFYDEFGEVRDALLNGDGDAKRFSRIANRFGVLAPGVHQFPGDFELAENEFRRYEGGLRVSGNLLAGEQSILYVRGDLSVGGSVLELGQYSLIVVGGRLECAAVRTQGELVALGGIVARRLFWTLQSDHSAYAPALRTELYVHDDRTDFIDDLTAAHEPDGSGIAELSERLGAEIVGDPLSEPFNISYIQGAMSRLR